MTDVEAQRRINAAVVALSEHFGSVQICGSWLLPSGATASAFSGSGDWYARKGLCQEFVERDQANTIAHSINAETPPPEGDEWKAQ